jgi:hypothetical protein
MQGFNSLGSAPRFLSMHAAVYNHFNARRHLIFARSYRAARSEAFLERHDACSMSPGMLGPFTRINYVDTGKIQQIQMDASAP